MTLPLSAPTLRSLNYFHQDLEDLFQQYRSSVLDKDLKKARTLWEVYERALLGHIREEDEILLPIYRQRAAPQRGGSPDLFVGEHQKIVEWLGRLKLRLSRLIPSSPAKDILALLDDQAFFKKLLEHHTQRENHIFYPELDRLVSPEEKTALLRLLSFKLGDEDPA